MEEMDAHDYHHGTGSYTPEEDAAARDLLERLKKVAVCFRNIFPEFRIFNASGNETVDYEDVFQLEDDGGDSLFHTVIVISIFCILVLVLVVRSSRGGSWLSCKVDKAAVKYDVRQKRLSDKPIIPHVQHRLYEIVPLGLPPHVESEVDLPATTDLKVTSSVLSENVVVASDDDGTR